MRKKVVLFALLAIAVAIVLVGCGSSGKKSSKSTSFVFASSADPVLLDPALVSDGESTWFEGVQLIALYAVIGIVFYAA